MVRYWEMEIVGGALAFEHEVDDARWVSVDEAARSSSATRATRRAGASHSGNPERS